MKHLGIIGHGNIGSALGQVFTNNGWRVDYFDLDTSKRTVPNLQELTELSDFLIIAAPSYANRSIAAQMAPFASGKLVTTVAKGVEPGFITMYEVLEDESDGQFTSAVLHGPMLATEIADGKPCTIMLASNNPDWSAGFRDDSQVNLIYGDDPYSVALCGILKNIYTIALGLNDGLKLGNNSKGIITVRAVDEYRRLLKVLGGNPELALSIVGIGDLVTTGWSEYSYNYKMGKKIATESRHEAKGEGVTSIKELQSRVKLQDYPLAQCLYEIVSGDTEPQILASLMR